MKKVKKVLKMTFLGIFAVFFVISFYFFLAEFVDFSERTEKPEEEKPKKEEKVKKEEHHLTLGMIGDALYHTGVYNDGRQSDGSYNYDSQLADITPIVSGYDLAYYNQESILGGTKLGLSAYPTFNSPQEVGDAYIKAGFNLVSLANNHTLDKGTNGVLNSVEYWKNKEVLAVGSYNSEEDRNRSHIGEKNGITYAFFAYTDSTNGIPVPAGKEYLVNVYSEEKVKADIESVKEKVDVVLVSMHWGEEYTHTPTDKQRKEAEYLSSLGVDVIIGSHPHVIQPIEHIGDTVVIYSLGNFISGQNGIEKRVGLIASLDIHKSIEGDKVTISMDNIKADLLYTYHVNYNHFRVIPFYKLDNSLLPGHENIRQKYEAIVNKNDESVQVGTLGT